MRWPMQLLADQDILYMPGVLRNDGESLVGRDNVKNAEVIQLILGQRRCE